MRDTLEEELMSKDEEKEQNSELKYSILTAEGILRIAALERLLVSKGVITQDELNKSYDHCVSQFATLLGHVLAKTEEKEEN